MINLRTLKTIFGLPDETPTEGLSLINSKQDNDKYAPNARPISDFGLDGVEPLLVRNGRELTIIKHDDDEESAQVYAGSWVREVIENAARNPVQPTWIGYEEPNTPLSGLSEIGILNEALSRHISVFGKSGYGKSTLLLNMMVQWAYSGYGFCFIDPKGDDAYNLMEMLPDHRLDDVIWIEPGSVTHEKVIGLNFLQTHLRPGQPGYDNEQEALINDIIPVLEDSSTGGFGATMDEIIRNVLRRMLEDPNNYSLIDLYYLLSIEEYREEIPEYYQSGKYQRLLPTAERIAKKPQDEVAPALRRLQTFAENRGARQIVNHRESNIDVHELVEGNKIIILRSSNADDDVKKLIATSIIRRIWSSIRQREKSDENDPYFIVADEFHNIVSNATNTDQMLSMGRSLGLSMCISTQYPSQLSKEVQQSLSNVENLISFNPGNPDDARDIGRLIGMEGDNLLKLPKYLAYCNLSIGDQDKTGPVRTNTFAPYPPIRTNPQARDAVTQIVNQYGKKPIEEEEAPSQNPLAGSLSSEAQEDETQRTRFVVTDDGRELTLHEVIESIFDAQLENGGKNQWTTVDNIATQFGRRLDDDISGDYGAKLARVFEQMPKGYVEKRMVGNDFHIRLTEDGLSQVFKTDSGSSGSGGKIGHRYMLEKSYLLFRRLGYDVTIPRQQGEMPDGIATPRWNPNNPKYSYTQAKNIEQKLKDEYPRLYNLFGPRIVNIEAEKATLTKPKQVFKNLIKAMKDDCVCAFIVQDAEQENGDFAHKAKLIDRWLTENKLVADSGYVTYPLFAEQENEELPMRTFYNQSKKLQLDTGAVAVKADDTNDVWKQIGDKLILDSPEGVDEPYIIFDTIHDILDPLPDELPYYYMHDASDGVIRLYRGDGKPVESYATIKQLKQAGYRPIHRPFIPEIELPGERYPTKDDYQIIILPDDTKQNMGPQLYTGNGEYTPLFTTQEDLDFINEKTEPEPEPEPTPEQTTEPTNDPKTQETPESQETNKQPETNEQPEKEPDTPTPPTQNEADKAPWERPE